MSEKKKVGRPTKLTPEIQQKIVQVIKLGNYIETAAAYAGISKQTLYDWMKKGARQEKGKYREFLDAVEKALAESEIRDLAMIEQAAKNGSWQAAAWRLERRFPKRWGKQDYMDILMRQQEQEKKTKRKRKIVMDFGRATRNKEGADDGLE